MSPRLLWNGREQAELTYKEWKPGKLERGLKNSHPEVLTRSSYNRIICADNLKGLAYLLRDAQEFDFIYIDPPYNTGQSFAYTDRHGSTDDWLSFLYPRICLGRDLLNSRGLMCVSIDDREAASLGVLLQEIFGKQNHILTIKWKKKRKPSFLSRHASAVFEYIYVFAKDAAKLPKLRGPFTSESSRPVLNHGNAISDRILKAGRPAYCTDEKITPGPKLIRTLAFELLDTLHIENGRIASDCRVKGPFRVSQSILDESVFITKQGGLRRHVLESERRFRHMTDDGSSWPTNEDADSEILALYGARIFPFAKPVGMLQQLVRMIPPASEQRSLHCLDFFAGTGSFGEAVFRQSKEDGHRRHFTLIQSPESLPPGASRVEKTIFDLAVTRIQSLNDCLFQTLVLEPHKTFEQQRIADRIEDNT